MPVRNKIFQFREKKDDMLRRKESQREMRKSMKIRGYWGKSADKNFHDHFNPIYVKKDSEHLKEFVVPNNTGFKTIEKVLKQNRYRIYDHLKTDRKLIYTLEITLAKVTDEKLEKVPFHIVKPNFVLKTRRDFSKSFSPLINFFYMKIAEKELKGTGWRLFSIDKLHVKLVPNKNLKGGCCDYDLPENFQNRVVLPKLKSKDEECLKDALTFLAKEELNFDGMEFPAGIAELIRFEKLNPKFLIYCYFVEEKDFGIFYKSKDFHDLKEQKTVLNVVMHENHFWPVTNDKAFHKMIFSERKCFVCKNCLTSYGQQEELDFHYKYCQKRFKTRLVYPKEGETLFFKKKWAGEMSPFVCYLDAECVLKPIHEKKGKTILFQKHELSYFGLLFINRLTNESEYFTFDSSDKLIRKLIQLSNYLKKGDKELEGEELEKANDALEEAEECEDCGSSFTDENHATRDHCHFTGKFRAILCNRCNLKKQKAKFLPVFCHNLMGYDEKRFIRSTYYKTTIKAKNMENFIFFSLDNYNIKFLDTFKFFQYKLSDLVDKLDLKDFKLTKKFFGKNYKLFTEKGIFPYSYFSSLEVLKEKQLPPKESFFDNLYEKEVSDKEYNFALKVWKKMDCKTFADYLHYYLMSDCTLLADVFEQYRKTIFQEYELDPAFYVTLPSLSFDCLLKKSGQKLELISDPTIYNFLEKGIRGGYCAVSKRLAYANNPYMKSYNPKERTSYILKLDANGLYSTPMLSPLPVSDFKFSDHPEDWEKFGDCMLSVDVSIPNHLKDDFSDYPLFPEKKNGKLIADYYPKKTYVCRSNYLKTCLRQGYTLEKVHDVLTYKSEPWMKSFVERNTDLRAKATSAIEKEIWKLKNNSVYGKQIENVRKRVDIQHANKYEVEKKYSKPEFKNIKELKDNEIWLLEMRNKKCVLNKPIYGGLAILDSSKIIMYEFLYDYLKPKFGKENVQLIYTDTDSFEVQIFCDDFYEEILPDIDDWFDTSNYPDDFKTLSGNSIPKKNKKVPGKFKDELAGEIINSFIALRPKMYCYKCESGKVGKRVKGFKDSISRRNIEFEDYLEVLKQETQKTGTMNLIRSRDHTLYTEKVEKILLDGKDTKRQILEDGINTRPFGY